MPSIDEIMMKREEQLAKRPTGDFGNTLQLRDDGTPGSVAIALCHMLYSGQAGDPYLEYYVAHGSPAIGKKGGRYTEIVYCPVESGHDENYDCAGCKADVPKKDRFAMWLYVDKILYNSLVGEEKYPPEQWIDGNRYFVQPVGKPMYWDTSAWKESPLVEIHRWAKQLTDLRSIQWQLMSNATWMDKRYHFFPVLNSQPIDPALYEKCKLEIRPVLDVLKDSIATVAVVDKPDEMPFSGPLSSGVPVNSVPTPITGAAAPTNTASTLPALPPFKAPSKSERLF